MIKPILVFGEPELAELVRVAKVLPDHLVSIVKLCILWAKRLLVAGDLTKNAAAGGSDFGSLQRFHKAFRLSEGMPPVVLCRSMSGKSAAGRLPDNVSRPASK